MSTPKLGEKEKPTAGDHGGPTLEYCMGKALFSSRLCEIVDDKAKRYGGKACIEIGGWVIPLTMKDANDNNANSTSNRSGIEYILYD